MAPAKTASPGRVTRLRCEHLENPLAVNVADVRLTWLYADSRPGAASSAYEIQVASSPERLAAAPDLWQTGRVPGDTVGPVRYAGRVPPRGIFFWRVRCWDRAGVPTPWSRTATWETGLRAARDWRAAWIGAAPALRGKAGDGTCVYFRQEFGAPARVVRARLYVAALGLTHVELNGAEISPDRLTPGWSEFDRRVQYCAYDVTSLLRAGGPNALGVILAEGWYAGRLGPPDFQFHHGEVPAFRLQLELTDARGQITLATTDDDWTCWRGPLRSSSLYDGESYDARTEKPDWSTAGTRPPRGQPAQRLAVGPRQLTAKRCPAVRCHQDVEPISVTRRKDGEWIVDFGQNLVGWTKVHWRGLRRGQRVTLRFAETLDADGGLYRANLRSARCTDEYIAAGHPEESWEPRFTFHGFRYVGLTGLDEAPAAIVARVAYNALPAAGHLQCSDPLLNRLQQNIVWSQRGNFLEVPTDCPQRDERLGWTGDAQVFFNTAAFNMEVATFFEKWLDDLVDAQHADGAFPDVAPNVLRSLPSKGNAAWADAGVICPWLLYLQTNDDAVLHRHYPAMRRWIDYQSRTSRNGVRPDTGFGDWLAIDAVKPEFAPTPRPLIGTAYFAHTTALVRRIAAIVGRPRGEQARLERLHRRLVARFREEFVTASGRVVGETQTGYALALAFDLLPERLRAAAAARLNDLIASRGNHLTTGFVGTPLLCPVLSRFGYHDTAAALVTRRQYPSWLYPVTLGATTIWERWNSYTPEAGFGDAAMNSFNHYAYGAVGEWLYAVLGGIAPLADHPGYSRIRCAPIPCGGVTSASAWHDTPRGRIVVAWKLTGRRLRCRVTLPPGTSAEFAPHRLEAGTLSVDGRRVTRTPLLSSGTHVIDYRQQPPPRR